MTKQMTDIKTAGEKMTFQNAVIYIKSLPLALTNIREMSTEMLWRVDGNSEIGYISVCYKSLVTGMAQIGIIPNK